MLLGITGKNRQIVETHLSQLVKHFLLQSDTVYKIPCSIYGPDYIIIKTTIKPKLKRHDCCIRLKHITQSAVADHIQNYFNI